MKEELIVSGRMNPNIDPVLHAWHSEIPIYLFLGGLAAGLLFFAALYFILGKEKEYSTAVKITPFIAPIAITVGLVALMLDLTHPLYFWRLYTSFSIESPMSWGAWVLMIITPLSMLWCLIYLKDFLGLFGDKFKKIGEIILNNKIIKETINISKKNQITIAWSMLILSVVLGVYTGILLSAFNARPLWNTSILGPLFLISGLSTAAATIIWTSKNHSERRLFSKIDLLLILVELFLIVHLFMGFLASTQAQIEAVNLFLGGEFTITFWLFVVILGLIIPAFLEALELKGFKIPVIIPVLLVLIGGLVFRFVMVEAGQVSHYIY